MIPGVCDVICSCIGSVALSLSLSRARTHSGHSEQLQQIAYDYGTHLGLAFQVIDDLLDLQQNTDELGKPAGNDMPCGVATAPVLFAADEFPHLKPLIERKFKGPHDVETVRVHTAHICVRCLCLVGSARC